MKTLYPALASLFVSAAFTTTTLAQADEPMDDAEADNASLEHVALRTDLGTIVLALDAQKTPISTENFLQYVEDDFYDGTIFHRVIKKFMVQGGGFVMEGEEMRQKPTRAPIANEWENDLNNTRGTIAMARTTDPNSATAQFFINVVDNNRLDQPISGGAGYTAFGTVVGGMEVVDTIENAATKVLTRNNIVTMRDVPEDTITINEALRLTPDEAEKLMENLSESNAEAIKAWTDGIDARAEAREAEWRAENEAQMTKAEQTLEGFGVDIDKAFKLESGLWLLDEKVGEGDEVQPGETVTVHYTLWLPDGKKLQSSRDTGRKFTQSLNAVIDAWKEGMVGMKPGGTRWMISPPYLAYGAAGRPGIPANSALIFKIDLFESSGN